MENLFSVICGKGGHRDNPDASQFRMTFRQIMYSILITSEKANCEEDVDDFLLSPENLQSEESCQSSKSETVSQQSDTIVDVWLPVADTSSILTIEEANIISYIGGIYLPQKIRYATTVVVCFIQI